MKNAAFKIVGISPLSQSKYIREKKPSQETDEDFEKRVWRQRIHVDDERMCFIPAMALKFGLAAMVKYNGMKVPGRAKSTYTKHFEAGILVTDNMDLGVTPDAFEEEWILVNSDGVRGSGKRVMRCYPRLKEWSCQASILIVDELITEEVLKIHLDLMGQLNGLGRFRPRQGGYYGRFVIEDLRVTAA